MKISFLCPSVSRTSGGIFEIERNLAQRLAQLPETSLQIFGPSDEYTQPDLPSWLPLRPLYFDYLGPSSFRYSLQLRRAFLASDADLSHMHALWMHNSILIRQWAKLWSRPYVITANGMLEKWALRNSGWKKQIALALYERNCLDNAACIQVNSEAEFKSVRAFGLSNPVCIIPNGVNLPEDADQNAKGKGLALQKEPPIERVRKVLLYLGRLHPKKGLVNLLKACAQLNETKHWPSQWTLAVAGWDQVGHENELKGLASQLGLLNLVVFLGPQFGHAKAATYRDCDAFILPSFSEGLPMAVLEAWSYGKPVLMTAECNLPEGFSANAALRIYSAVDSIADQLEKFFQMSGSEREIIGQNGLALVKNNFTWTRIAHQMRSVYAWILGSGPKPQPVVD